MNIDRGDASQVLGLGHRELLLRSFVVKEMCCTHVLDASWLDVSWTGIVNHLICPGTDFDIRSNEQVLLNFHTF